MSVTSSRKRRRNEGLCVSSLRASDSCDVRPALVGGMPILGQRAPSSRAFSTQVAQQPSGYATQAIRLWGAPAHEVPVGHRGLRRLQHAREAHVRDLGRHVLGQRVQQDVGRLDVVVDHLAPRAL